MLTDQYDGDQEEEEKKPAPFRNKNKVLILSTRGVGYRIRHLMQDFMDLCPHSKKDVKIAEKSRLESVNEVCEMKGCNLSMFFEARKGKDFYLWLARSPDGPSMKFHMLNSKSPSAALPSAPTCPCCSTPDRPVAPPPRSTHVAGAAHDGQLPQGFAPTSLL
jgi:hypothetical protein